MNEWYYARNKERYGPVPEREVRALLDGGQLGPNDLVWTEGMPDWGKAAAVFDVPASRGQIATTPPVRTANRFAETTPYPTRERARAETQNPFSPPERDLEPGDWEERPRRRRVEYAGFWLRFIAMILDGFIYMFLVIGAMVVVGVIGAVLRNVGVPQQTVALVVIGPALFITFLGPWLYHAIQESSEARATMGKRALGIEVVGMRGERITFGQASGRFFGKILSGMILYIGFIMAGFTERKQALHDVLASTLVIRR
jgi:uncharacterized RDD family membrane protein YckC